MMIQGVFDMWQLLQWEFSMDIGFIWVVGTLVRSSLVPASEHKNTQRP